MPGYRVLVHASERDRVPVALNNAKNLIAGLGVGAVEVRVVAYADGVEGLRASGPNTVLMDLLASHGAGFVVCANTLRSRNLTAEDFPDYVETVPSGVVEPVIRPALPPAVKKKDILCKQDCVHNAVLAWSADDPRAPHICPDDGAPGQEAPPNVVRVGAVCLDRLYLRLPGLAGRGVCDCRVVHPECPDLLVTAVGADNPLALFTNVCLCRSSSDLRPLLALGGVIAPARRLPY